MNSRAADPDNPPKCLGFLGADWWGSDARAMAAEFRRRGHLLLERHYEDYFPTKWQSPLLKAVRRTLRPVMAWEYNRAVEELLEVRSLDFLLVFKGMLLKPETLSKFVRKGIPCYCYYPDVSFHDHGRNIPRCLPLYDRVFTSKLAHLDDPGVQSLGSEWDHVRHGFDPEVHRPVMVGGKGADIYACDVSFVGCWSPKKEALLAGLLSRLPKLQLKIWGPAWAHSGNLVRSHWMGRGAYGDELAAIYSLSKINLGLLSEAGKGVTQGDSTTARTWQIPGAGGFLLHEDTPEVRAVFDGLKEICLFGSPEQLAFQIQFYLSNEVARLAVAATGHRRALSEPYTYAKAVDRILERHAARGGQR